MVARKEDMNRAVVYSTEHGRMCPGCGKPKEQCVCGQKKALPKGDGIVRVRLETKGRNGKGVTVIAGVPLDDEGLNGLAKQLKQRCGSGGTVKDGVIEIQGDHRDTVMKELAVAGCRVKKAGG